MIARAFVVPILVCVASLTLGCSSASQKGGSTPRESLEESTDQVSPRLPDPGEEPTDEGRKRDRPGMDEAWPDPEPGRPMVDLRFVVARDLRSVEGEKDVTFTPDLETCELVFRLWPNMPLTAASGNALEVTAVRVNERRAPFEKRQAGAPPDAPGTLLEVPLPACVPAGTVVTAELEFSLTLGEGTNERIGFASTGDLAWFGSAFPLLAWEDGRGWAREPAVRVSGEMATSETFDLRSLEVTASHEHAVLGVGEFSNARESPDGTTTHRFSAPAVRDVAVSVGRMQVVEREVAGARLHVGAPAQVRHPPEEWAAQLEQTLWDVSSYLGAIPYDDIWVTVVPDLTSGVEFPGALQFGDRSLVDDQWLLTHEVAHLWFYGLVGNNQARDPWLDEAFATFVQKVVDDESADAPAPGEEGFQGGVGRPMTYWETYERPSQTYVERVYDEGAAALLEARRRAGDRRFDAALHEYLMEHAHRIAEPHHLAATFAALPDVLEVLCEAGALSIEDVETVASPEIVASCEADPRSDPQQLDSAREDNQ